MLWLPYVNLLDTTAYFFVFDNRMKLLISSQRIQAKQHLMPLVKYNEDYVSKFDHIVYNFIYMITTLNLKMVFTWLLFCCLLVCVQLLLMPVVWFTSSPLHFYLLYAFRLNTPIVCQFPWHYLSLYLTIDF